MVECSGERDVTLGSSGGQGGKRFDDARRKLHQLMQRWDQFPTGERAIFGEDQAQVRGLFRIADKGELGIAMLVPQPEYGTGEIQRRRNKGLMLILNIEIMDCAERGVAIAVRPKLAIGG